MRDTRLIELSDSERLALTTLERQTKQARSNRRIRALLKLDAGDPPELVAEALDVNLVSVYRWAKRYVRNRRAEDLLEGQRSGRPSLLSALDAQRIDQLLADSPERHGYRSTIWTVALLGGHIQRHFGIRVSDETLRRYLHQHDYRWKRPRYVYHTPDPHKGQKKGASFQR
jgi:transposase